jgi:serine/threonine protein kinase
MAEKMYGNRWKVIQEKSVDKKGKAILKDLSIGKGGQALVYLVEDVNTKEHTRYALKRLSDTNRIDRFKVERDSLEKLQHPSIIKTVDSNVEGEKPYYIVMEYCEGGHLCFDKISDLHIIDILYIFLEVCRAIGFAHENNIVHRDIKPENILFKDDTLTPIVSDFGICFPTENGFERLTIEDYRIVGAKFYMAPEFESGKATEVPKSSDVYSLGKLLYWMVTDNVETREDYLYEANKDLRNIFKNEHAFHFIYERIFEKTIKLNPSDRFQDANELAKKVEKMIEDIENEARCLDIQLSQKCIFCKAGEYKFYWNNPHLKQLSANDTENFTAICNYCGNTQIFNRILFEIEKTWKNLDSIKRS